MQSKRVVKHILLIDDDESTRLTLARILEGNGFRTEQAASVGEAIEKVGACTPHLVILDLKLGQERGFEYLEAHKTVHGLKGVPVIVHSGERDRTVVYQAMSMGAFDYVPKPVDATLLILKVKKALKDQSFPSARIAARDPRGLATLKVSGSIVMANENGFLLEAPVRLAEGRRVGIVSPFLSQLGCAQSVFQQAGKPAQQRPDGQFRNEISVVGIDPSAALLIRQVMRASK